jgi:hypothetical protein
MMRVNSVGNRCLRQKAAVGANNHPGSGELLIGPEYLFDEETASIPA